MKPRIILTSILIILGFIIAAVPAYKTNVSVETPEDILIEVRSGVHFISTDEVAHLIVSKDPSLQLIDVRTPEEFDKFNLPGSINIPIDDILSDDWKDYFSNSIKSNVLYSNGTTTSNEAWMILKQKGYAGIYVMHGGLNYWAETIMNPEPPATSSPDDEIALYDFRKGANQALGGGSASINQEKQTTTTKPLVVKKKKKKKRAAGGC
jgi:rhodanese-related sulfurtransferase